VNAPPSRSAAGSVPHRDEADRNARGTALADWPGLERLERLSDFLARLKSLPEQVGPLDLRRLRETRLPLPASWPALLSAADESSKARVPAEVDPAWLSAVLLASTEPFPQRLLAVVDQIRNQPDWTLTAIWLLESALAWPGPASPLRQGLLLSELGDLYCQTGDIVQGVRLLDDGRALLGREHPDSWLCQLRAAGWITLINPTAATDRLRQLLDGSPVAVRLQAELELLAQEAGVPDSISPQRAPEPAADAHTLMDCARAAEELVARAATLGLNPAELRSLRTRARYLSGRWLGASRIRQLRVDGRDRLLEALHESSESDDFRALSQLLDALGRAHLRLGAFRHARNCFEESIGLKQKLRDLWGLGTSLTGLAECLLASGQPLESLPCFQVNLALLETLGGMQVLFVRNLARHLNALVAAGCDPLETTPPAPELLALARELLDRYTSFIISSEDDPYCLLLGGGYRRLAARTAQSEEERKQHVEEGVRQAERARQLFSQEGNWLRVAEANRTLAALYLDRAASASRTSHDLACGKHALEEAELRRQGESGRVQSELLWARYHHLAGAPYQMQLHLAAARRAAEASGYQALALGVDARLGVQLTGPTGAALPARVRAGLVEPDEVVLVALPGERISLEVRASDWRDRPLPAYVLHGVIEAEEGPCPVAAPAQVRTDHLGRAHFEIQAGEPSRSVFRAATPDGVHSLSLRVVVRPVAIEWPAELAPMEKGEGRLLRQLFGPDCPRLSITRTFTSGHSGTRVLLVEPSRDGEQGAFGEEMRGQPCIVKLGPRGLLEDERRRYLRWVKDLLPVNISRLDGFTVWHDTAALRMSLVGDISRGEVREAREWLAGATAFDAHLLLERVFVGDLAACWYGNSPRLLEARPVGELYGLMIPCLVHLADTTPPGGTSSARAPDSPLRLEDGVRPPSARSFQIGEKLAVAEPTLLGYRQTSSGWEYEMQAGRNGLRFTFRTPLSPELFEEEGTPSGSRVPVVAGVIEDTAYDRLNRALHSCCSVFKATHPSESVIFSPDERFLLVETEQLSRRLSNPLDHLARLMGTALACNWSLIHGDLHGRNILVGPQGQPFYIDFARTGYGPTLFDFIKFEVYLWHECFAAWPHGEPPEECNLTRALQLMEEFCSADPVRHFPSPYARHGDRVAERRSTWPERFRQCLATLRSAARPHVVDPGGLDYFLPLALYSGLMLRWCDPTEADEKQRRKLARQGVVHALAAAALIDGVLRAE
jgi:tetratricopeptide (TPR) repeat protein